MVTHGTLDRRGKDTRRGATQQNNKKKFDVFSQLAVTYALHENLFRGRVEEKKRTLELSQRQRAVAASHQEASSAVLAEPCCKSLCGEPPNQLVFECEVKKLLELAERGSYYQLLAVTAESPGNQIRKNFYTLAKKFHPDHHMEQHGLILKQLMGITTEAYKTLIDEQKRIAYDRSLVASGSFSMH